MTIGPSDDSTSCRPPAASKRWAWLSWAGLIAVVCPLLATGCTRQRAPGLLVGEPAITTSSDEAIALSFSVEMTNPNPVELELRDFKYRLSVDGREVYRGRRSAEATLPGAGGKRVEIPAVIPYAGLGWSAKSTPAEATYSISGSLTYVTPGQIAEILFDTGVRKPRVSFSRRGSLALSAPGS